MTIMEYLKETLTVSAPTVQQSEIEKMFGIYLEKEPKKIISHIDSEIFFEGQNFLKLLSKQEILDCCGDLNVDFINKKIIPVFDLGDNDYIVFSYGDNWWYKFNIVDEVLFSKHKSIIEFFI